MGFFRILKKSKPLDGTYHRDRNEDAEYKYYDSGAYSEGDIFRIVVEDVFLIAGRGTVITGRVASGSVTVGDTVMLHRQDGSSAEVTITGMEMFRKMVNTAVKGDNVGLLLRGVEKGEVGRGDILEQRAALQEFRG